MNLYSHPTLKCKEKTTFVTTKMAKRVNKVKFTRTNAPVENVNPLCVNLK